MQFPKQYICSQHPLCFIWIIESLLSMLFCLFEQIQFLRNANYQDNFVCAFIKHLLFLLLLLDLHNHNFVVVVVVVVLLVLIRANLSFANFSKDSKFSKRFPHHPKLRFIKLLQLVGYTTPIVIAVSFRIQFRRKCY